MDDGSLFPAADESQDLGANIGRVVRLLEPLLGPGGAEPIPLDGGITNRNFRVRLGDCDYVVRLPGKDTGLLGIDRSAERIANERAAQVGIAPPVAAALGQPQAIVTIFVDGEGMDPAALREPAALTQVARSLRAIHELGEPLPVSFDSFRVVEAYAQTARERGGRLPAEEYRHGSETAARIEAALSGAEHEPVPCHNDLLAANFIRGEKQIWIVDWEYAGMGNRYFDLANFAVNNELDEAQERVLLADYFGAAPDARRHATLRLMRFMSDFREAMWGVLQATVSELDFDFDGYGARHFERMQATAAHPEFESWLEAVGEPTG